LNVLDIFSKNNQISYFLNILPIGAEFFHSDGRTDRQTDRERQSERQTDGQTDRERQTDGQTEGQSDRRHMTDVIFAFHKFAKSPENNENIAHIFPPQNCFHTPAIVRILKDVFL